MKVVSVAVGALAAYLISNGFNALNVQLRPRGIDPVISGEDLSITSNQSMPALSTNVTHTFPETQPRNPITNSILRNAVLPRVLNQQPSCKGLDAAVPETDVKYGFTQRDWQTRLLQEALPVKQLRVVVTPENATIQDGATSADLPMDAALAADLYLYTTILVVDTFATTNYFMNRTDIVSRHPIIEDPNNTAKYPPELVNASLAKVMGFLPQEDTDEKTQRDFLLNKSTASLRHHFATVGNTSTAELVLTFSSVQISDNIVFDAITIEFEIDPMVMASSWSEDNTTRFTDIPSHISCGPIPGQCMFRKVLYGSNNTSTTRQRRSRRSRSV